VPPGDVDALARAIAAYAHHPVQLAAHGAGGRRRAEERFSIGAMVAAYEGVYERVLQPGRVPLTVPQERS
jgi:glycosyltransferase involved in cell wall biosynthesis